jgi:hypothetical protein
VISLVIGRKSEEGTQSRARCEFVRGCGGEVGVACTPQRSEIVVRRKHAVKGKERGAHVKGFSGETVGQMSGGGKGVSQVGGRHGGLEK